MYYWLSVLAIFAGLAAGATCTIDPDAATDVRALRFANLVDAMDADICDSIRHVNMVDVVDTDADDAALPADPIVAFGSVRCIVDPTAKPDAANLVFANVVDAIDDGACDVIIVK